MDASEEILYFDTFRVVFFSAILDNVRPSDDLWRGWKVQMESFWPHQGNETCSIDIEKEVKTDITFLSTKNDVVHILWCLLCWRLAIKKKKEFYG